MGQLLADTKTCIFKTQGVKQDPVSKGITIHKHAESEGQGVLGFTPDEADHRPQTVALVKSFGHQPPE